MLIQLNNISKRYGSAEIFDNVNVTFAAKNKIGVIGRNGAGKSTLCKIITGEEEADSGVVDKSRELRLSYLEQHDPFDKNETVLEFLQRYTHKEDWKCGKAAGRFQIKNSLLISTPIGDLSGGYQTRVKLTAMLLRDPNFLVLDEPTNFLDLSTLILLENFLKEYPGAFLIVSHDREFLKKTCEQTLEIENADVTLFPGNVEEYFEYKADIIRQKTQYNKNLETKQKQLSAFVERFRAKNTKARQAQSKLKQLKKLEKIEIDHPISTVTIRIPAVHIRKGLAAACENLSIGYPEKTVASDINLRIVRGERFAVLGDNGQGKTTFLKTLAGVIPALDGDYTWSKLVTVGYYAQNVYANLDPNDDIITYLQKQAAPDVFRQEILNIAGSFLFRGDDVLKPIKVLSGGERARLCLAGLLLAKKATLLLDEPTNHLDFETVEALGAALRDYTGTVLFVSHDRTFVNMVSTGILDVKDGDIVHYPGTYEEYVYRLEQQARPDSARGGNNSTGAEKNTAEKKSDFHTRKELKSRINKLRTQAKKLEEEIAKYDKEKQATVTIFSLKPENYSLGLNKRYDELLQLLADRENRWLAIQETIEECKSQIS